MDAFAVVAGGLAQRARIVLLAADGTPVTEIVRRVGGVHADGDRLERRCAVEGLGGAG
ncbi:MAG TPA: hypothetical protein VFR23_06760 [Jiangellaceae bacterium]|nr:hypothetical protein [Jiangellaceae bacterium]